MYDELTEKLQAAGILKNFHFAGLVPPGEVASYIAQADMLWHLSLHEGLPRAVVQALAVGIPAIGFALDGTPEVVIDGETGFLTAAEDIDDVAEKTVKLLDDPTLRRRLGMAGKEKVLEQFAWQKMADILEKEYLLLLCQKTAKDSGEISRS
jgi:glycosyltransferase involved in cell wall biosynthesis